MKFLLVLLGVMIVGSIAAFGYEGVIDLRTDWCIDHVPRSKLKEPSTYLPGDPQYWNAEIAYWDAQVSYSKKVEACYDSRR